MSSKTYKQFGAVPYRRTEAGEIEVLLITSRETGRWVIPKGWPMRGRAPQKAAAIEAYEEAGALGKPSKSALGSYSYGKRMKSETRACRVTVYPLAVESLADNWPERDERRREWFGPSAAAERVDEPELRSIFLGLDGML
jgi:8-oxo-dGTP pyrophosphatase MutT (NUDIX family)